MKKALSLIIVAIMLTFLLVACGDSDGGTDGGRPVLNVSVFAQEHEQEMYREVISQFEEEKDVTVNFTVAGDQYWPELEAAVTANAAPDVFYLGLGDIRRRVWADKVEALDNLLDVQTLNRIWPDALDLYRYDVATDTLGVGNIYALPKDFSAVSMVVNKAIIEKRRAEIEALVADGSLPFFPEIDANGNLPVYTFTEFATLCEALTFDDPTLPDTAGSTQVFGTHLDNVDFILPAFVWGAGGEFLSADRTQVLFDTQAFIDGFHGFMQPVARNASGLPTDEMGGYQKFLQGRIAYYPCGTWDIGAFQAIADDEAVNPGRAWFDYDVAPWPISDNYANLSIAERQDKWFGRVDSVGYAVSTGSSNKELAAELAYLLSADEDVQRFVTARGGQLPNLVDMALGEYLTDDSYFPPGRQVFVNMLMGQNGKRVPTSLTFNGLWYTEGLVAGQDSVWSYYSGIDLGVTPMSAEEYCRSIQSHAQALLTQSIQDAADLNPNR